MIHLVLIFCLASAPSKALECKEVRPDIDAVSSLAGCAQQAQFTASTMLETRLDLQGWQLARFRCEMGKREERAL
jgi:hypothetical protein